MRLIDADVLKQHIDKLPALPDGNFAGNHSALKALINMQPTIQPVATDINVGDTISRQAAIDALDFEIVYMTAYCDWKNKGNPLAQYNKGLEDGKKAIEALPPAQPEQKWIPCSERCPKENGYYLTTTINKEVYCDYWSYDHFDRTEAVIAWMKLPEPYAERRTDGKNR